MRAIAAHGTMHGNVPYTIITNRGPDSVMLGKDKLIPDSYCMTATTFLIIGILVSGTLFAFPLVLNQIPFVNHVFNKSINNNSLA